jgi:hypothetical protein
VLRQRRELTSVLVFTLVAAVSIMLDVRCLRRLRMRIVMFGRGDFGVTAVVRFGSYTQVIVDFVAQLVQLVDNAIFAFFGYCNDTSSSSTISRSVGHALLCSPRSLWREAVTAGARGCG